MNNHNKKLLSISEAMDFYQIFIQMIFPIAQKEVIELFNLKTGNEYSDIRTSHIDDNILQLSECVYISTL